MTYNTAPLVLRSGVRPNWLSGERFWYRIATAEGSEFVVIDPLRGTRSPAFDHTKLAASLSAAASARYDATHLPFTEIEFDDEGQRVSFDVGGRHWTCPVDGGQCAASKGSRPANSLLSPDKTRTAFIREFNLWVRDVATGKETQLTTDGVKDFGYATDNAGWTRSDRAIVLWSPDSKKIATFQQDQRGVGEMYLVDTRVGHPNLQAWKYPLPGDDVVTTIQRVIVSLGGAPVVRLKMPPDQHRSTLCDHIICRGGDWADVEWSPDSTQLAFVSTSRDHKQEKLQIADAASGAVREVLEETVPTFFESGNGRVNWRYLADSNEIIWFSERDNRGHLYLYDLATGSLKNRITTGEWNVTQLLRVDSRNRMLYFLGVGREKGRDPYFVHLYSAGFDGKQLELLTPEDANHEITLSPSGRFFSDSYSKPDVPPVAVLRDAGGRQVSVLEKADISRLSAAGWKPPIPFTVKARDGVTDLYGLMMKPTRFDPARKYPIVNHIYPGPQTGSVGSRSFSASRGTRRPSPNSGSSLFKSMAWARRGDRRNSTKPISAISETTPYRTRWPECGNWRSGTPGSTSIARASTAIRVGDTPRRTPCSAIRNSSRSGSPKRAITTTASMKTIGRKNGLACWNASPTAPAITTTRRTRASRRI